MVKEQGQIEFPWEGKEKRFPTRLEELTFDYIFNRERYFGEITSEELSPLTEEQYRITRYPSGRCPDGRKDIRFCIPQKNIYASSWGTDTKIGIENVTTKDNRVIVRVYFRGEDGILEQRDVETDIQNKKGCILSSIKDEQENFSLAFKKSWIDPIHSDEGGEYYEYFSFPKTDLEGMTGFSGKFGINYNIKALEDEGQKFGILRIGATTKLENEWGRNVDGELLNGICFNFCSSPDGFFIDEENPFFYGTMRELKINGRQDRDEPQIAIYRRLEAEKFIDRKLSYPGNYMKIPFMRKDKLSRFRVMGLDIHRKRLLEEAMVIAKRILPKKVEHLQRKDPDSPNSISGFRRAFRSFPSRFQKEIAKKGFYYTGRERRQIDFEYR